MQGRNAAGGLLRRAGFPHNFESFALQQFLESAPDQLVVVKDEDPYGILGRSIAGLRDWCFHSAILPDRGAVR
ncbi:hypothetical protein GCM10027402_03460 [Arthrobacter monumenti]